MPPPRERPHLAQTLMAIAGLWADRSTCLRGSVGCVIADNRGVILSSGYNGAPAGAPHCEEVGCLIEGGHCVRAVHAEVNAVAAAAQRGVSLSQSWAYVTVRPCLRCTYLLIGAGVKHIRYYFDAGSEAETKQTMAAACSRASVSLFQQHNEDHYGLLVYRQQPKAEVQ